MAQAEIVFGIATMVENGADKVGVVVNDQVVALSTIASGCINSKETGLANGR